MTAPSTRAPRFAPSTMKARRPSAPSSSKTASSKATCKPTTPASWAWRPPAMAAKATNPRPRRDDQHRDARRRPRPERDRRSIWRPLGRRFRRRSGRHHQRQFRLSVYGGLPVENGKVVAPVKNATLIGHGPNAARRDDDRQRLLAWMTASARGGLPVRPGWRGPAHPESRLSHSRRRRLSASVQEIGADSQARNSLAAITGSSIGASVGLLMLYHSG